jgi:hypothetical protein
VPDRRKITTDVSGDVAIACRRAARRANLTLTRWAEVALAEAAAREGGAR